MIILSTVAMMLTKVQPVIVSIAITRMSAAAVTYMIRMGGRK